MAFKHSQVWALDIGPAGRLIIGVKDERARIELQIGAPERGAVQELDMETLGELEQILQDVRDALEPELQLGPFYATDEEGDAFTMVTYPSESETDKDVIGHG